MTSSQLTLYLTICLLSARVNSHASDPLLLVISLGGFRWDYLHKVQTAGRTTPNFDRIINMGVKADYVQPVYPPKTFPAHFSIVTGLHPESHGLVANIFYDPVFNQTFDMNNDSLHSESKWFDGGGTVEPIWITNQKVSPIPRRSGSIFWPGDNAKYGELGGTLPYRYITWSEWPDYENQTKRLDTMLDWFSCAPDPINLGFLHIEEPDHTGHMFGPDSTEMIDKILELDGLLGHMLERLDHCGLMSRMNIIITSDHGMAAIKTKTAVDNYVNPKLYEEFGYSPMWQILTDHRESVEEAFLAMAKERPEIKAQSKENLPVEFHYTRNRRIQDLIVTINDSFQLIHNMSDPGKVVADHGYDNRIPSQRAFFMAFGPAFKVNYTMKAFSQLDLYPLMCHVLGLEPRPHNGSLADVEGMLRQDTDNFFITAITFLACVGFAVAVSGVCCVMACRVYKINRLHSHRQRRQTLDKELSGAGEDSTNKPLLTSDEETV